MAELERCPETYQSNNEIVVVHLAHILPSILEKLEWMKDELILDHGCATGSTALKYFAPLAEKHDSTVYLFDICKAQLEYAEKNFYHKNFKYIHGDLQSNPSPLAGLRFNKIFSIFTLHFVHDFKAELKALYDLLVPGGELVLINVTECIIFDLFHNVKNHQRHGHKAAHHLVVPKWRHDDESNESIFLKSFVEVGFEVIDFSIQEKTHKFKRPATFASNHAELTRAIVHLGLIWFTLTHEFLISDMIFALNGSQKHLEEDQHDDLKDVYHKFFHETETKHHKPHAKAADSEYHFHYDRLEALLKKPSA